MPQPRQRHTEPRPDGAVRRWTRPARTAAFLAAFVLGSGACRAEEFELYSAAAAGAAAWSADNARIVQKGRTLVITEDNRSGSFGCVFLTKTLPFLPDASLEIDVKQVVAGNYNVQALAFKGNNHIHTSDIVETSNRPVKQKLPLKFMGFPPETESILVKVWVTDIDGACIRLNDIRYGLDVAPEKIGLDETLIEAAAWKADNCSWTPGADGARITLSPGKNSGSLEREQRVKKPANGLLFLQIPDANGGLLTVQLVVFDAQGNYLESIDALAGIGAGSCSVKLDALKWPEGAAEFSVKLWLNGTANASARVKRLAVLDLN